MVLVKVGEKIEEMDNMRNVMNKDLKKLQSSPPEAFLNKAVDCHLRMSSVAQKNKEKCKLCSVHDNIEIYEQLIFHFVRGEVKAMKNKHVRETLTTDENKKLEEAGVYMHDEQERGTWSDSEAERLLRAILKYAKQFLFDKDVIEDGNTHMKLLEAMKKEFKLLRILWRQIYDNVAAVDELNMSIMRLRLRFEDEPITSENKMKIKKDSKKAANLSTRVQDKVETIYILEKHELPSQRLKLVSEKTVSMNEFRKKNGQLLYLENLKSSDFGKKGGGENPEPCPICQKSLGMQWSVLGCGHCFCVDCIRILIEEYSTGGSSRSVKCAICRNLTHHAEISYVNTKVDHKTEEDSKAYEAVKGSLSTKMEAVVKTLIKIQNDDPNAKSLVFSTWNSVLDILGSALITNDIQFAALHTQGKFKRNLQKFKNRQDVKVLLLPISSGANGLNLIEASHVLLIEPILNPAQELQAIGRVHRIGQTKPTTIHRFLIRSTIEERMYKMLSSYKLEENEQSSHSTEENILTIKDLASLFVDG